MRKQDYYQIKNEFEKNYPVFIAFCSSLLAFFSFFLQFKDMFSGWNILFAACIAFVLSVAISWFLSKALYTFIRKQSFNKNRTSYDIIESCDVCEFLNNDFTYAKYKRIEKIKINVDVTTQITYKLPSVTAPGSIQNINCYVNNKRVSYTYHKRYGEDLYGYFVNPEEFQEGLDISWEFDILNSFTAEDNIRVRSFRALKKCVIRILFNNFNQLIIAESYKMYGDDDESFTKGDVDMQSTNKQIIIEKDFSKQLDGGKYRFGIQWESNEDRSIIS
ncbi:MAG: hypothetical protein JWN78_2482 [Bacteroidota bacterium]|nr:hypothetical protein [Bacteroidota bacterium]